MFRKLKIFHTADIHLGAAPDADRDWGAARKQELWDTFEKLIERTGEEKADLLLIAGDLFHRPPLLRELREVNYLFSTIPGTRVVLMAGNHDCIGKNSFYRGFAWADNVTFFHGGPIQSVEFPELGVDVYGTSYEDREQRARIYDNVHPADNGCYHILLGHGGDEKHAPFGREQLLKSGFDYMAFGHIHKPGTILPGRAVMSGSLEPTDHTCDGVHGFVKVEVTETGNEIQLVPLASREYRVIRLAVGENDSAGALYRRASEEIHVRGSRHIYELILEGRRAPELLLLEEKFFAAGNVFSVKDETVLAYDYEQLKEKYEGRLLERFIRSFENCDTYTEQRALEAGTKALLEAMEQ